MHPFPPLQRCGNVCGVIVSISSVIISVNPGLFISLCKAKNSNHQLAYLKDVSSYNCLLRVFLMKWCLSGKFDLKDVISATSGSTLNPTRKSTERAFQLMMTVYKTLKKVIILKVSLENKAIRKIKTTAKTLLKISCPVIVAIQQKNLIFTCAMI